MAGRQHNNSKTTIMITVAFIGALIAIVVIYDGSTWPYGSLANKTNGTISNPTPIVNSTVNSTTAPPNITITNSSPIVLENLPEELNNSAQNGFDVNASIFAATSASQCSIRHITACDNNVPAQFICVNSNYSSEITAQYGSIYNNSRQACPLFMMAGTLSCGVASSSCVVTGLVPNSH